MLLELPHTAGCFVCGRENPLGLRLCSFVDTDTGNARTTFTPRLEHIGFENIIHGGILATLVDELMVWTAIWASGKACVAAELSLRFVRKAEPNQQLEAIASITRNRSRLIETSAEVKACETLICTATAKYIPLGGDETAAFFKTLIDEPATIAATQLLNARP